MCQGYSTGMVVAALLLSGTARATEELGIPDAFVEQTMQQWNVPGLAIAVVRDGEVVLARGYGVCRTGEQTRVTEDTVFAIASSTKSFTATAVGLLVDEKKLHWDDPVRKHLPDFELFDPFVTREVTIRDLLAHRTGLELADLLWSKNEFTSDHIMRRLRYVKPKHSFRSRFTYNNLMYLAAGRVIEKVTGQSWSEYLEQALLRPLQMDSTTCSCPADANIAWPHTEDGGAAVAINLERGYSDTIGPAGSIWSTASDMARWVRWNLGSDDDAKPAIQPDTRFEMFSPQVIIPNNDKGTVYPRKRHASYGLGWFVEDYRGRKLVRNSGSTNGYISWVGMLPEERFGFVILANSHRTGINFALHHRILDEFLGEPRKDWSTIVRNDYTNGWLKMLRDARAAYEQKRRTDTKPTLEPAGYTGTYRNALFGDLTIRETESGLAFRFGPRRVARLEHWQDNTFQADFTNPAIEDWHVTFRVTANGAVESVQAVAAPWAPAWHDDGTIVGNFRKVSNSTPEADDNGRH